MNDSVSIREVCARYCAPSSIELMFMNDLRIGTRTYRKVIGLVGKECESLVKRDIVPITHIAAPRCGYVPTGAVPDFDVFRMPSCPCARIGVQFANGEVA